MSRYVIARVHDGVYLPTPRPVTLPAMQPGDSVRVTMTDDGGFDVAPLRHGGTRRLDDGMGGTIGPCRPSTVIDLWADAPEQENDR